MYLEGAEEFDGVIFGGEEAFEAKAEVEFLELGFGGEGAVEGEEVGFLEAGLEVGVGAVG